MVSCSTFFPVQNTYGPDKRIAAQSSEPRPPLNSLKRTRPNEEPTDAKPTTKNITLNSEIDRMIANMSLEEKAGQLLVIGFSGKSLNKQSLQILKKIHPGGVILFSRNISSYKQLRRLTDQIQKSSLRRTSLPKFIMLDQEGGVVTRVKVGTSLPSAFSLGETHHLPFIYQYSLTMGSLLNQLGVNMNLAPVLDISDPDAPSFIGSRSFGSAPDEVGSLGETFAQGQWNAGVIPTAKHFPGHGGLQTDSHKATPKKNLTYSELQQNDLIPFQKFSDLNFPTAMMLGHVSFPKIDASAYPAAFSKKLNHELLREKMNYSGLAITDDLEMTGAEKVGTIAERTVQAVLAGNDMIMVAWSRNRQISAHRTLVQAIKEGVIPQDRLNDSLRRILKAKILVSQKAKLFNEKQVEQLRRKLVQQSKEVKKLSFQSSLKDGGSSKTIPTIHEDIEVYSSDPVFFKNFKSRFLKKASWFSLSKNNVEKRIVHLNQRNSVKPFVFYVSGKITARWLDQLNPLQKSGAIVINTNQPGAIKNPEQFLKVVHMGSSSPESGAWLAEFLNQSHGIRKPTSDYGYFKFKPVKESVFTPRSK